MVMGKGRLLTPSIQSAVPCGSARGAQLGDVGEYDGDVGAYVGLHGRSAVCAV